MRNTITYLFKDFNNCRSLKYKNKKIVMSIRVKNSQLSVDALNALNKIIEEDINAAAAFKLSRIVKYISDIVQTKTETEQKILEKWSKKDEFGKVIRPKDELDNEIPDAVFLEDVDKFSEEMSSLMNVENEIPFEKLKFEELGLKTIKVKDLIKIEFLFDSE